MQGGATRAWNIVAFATNVKPCTAIDWNFPMATTHEQKMLAVLEQIAGSLTSIKDDIRYLRNRDAETNANTPLHAPVKVRPTRADRHVDRYVDFDVFTGR